MAVVRSDRVDAVRGFGVVQLVREAGLEVAGCAAGESFVAAKPFAVDDLLATVL